MSLRTRYRLHQFGNRLQVFLLGLLFGIVLSGGFFLLKLDDYVKDFAMNNPLVNQDDKEEDETSTQDQSTDKQVKPKKNNTTTDVSDENDVTDVNDSLSSDDTTGNVFITDPNGEIVVRTNELLGEKVISLVNLDGIKAIDSIRSKEAGIKEEPGKSVTVEFWRSPLNYKGYTLSRSRLVLFGFGTDENIALYRLDQSMFMKTNGGVFRLENTADFRQLERVTDESLLARLQ